MSLPPATHPGERLMTRMWRPADATAMTRPRLLLARAAMLLLILEVFVAWSVAPLLFAIGVIGPPGQDRASLSRLLLLGLGSVSLISLPILVAGIVVFYRTRKGPHLTTFQRRVLIALAAVEGFWLLWRWLLQDPRDHILANLFFSALLVVILAECVLRLRRAPQHPP